MKTNVELLNAGWAVSKVSINGKIKYEQLSDVEKQYANICPPNPMTGGNFTVKDNYCTYKTIGVLSYADKSVPTGLSTVQNVPSYLDSSGNWQPVGYVYNTSTHKYEKMDNPMANQMQANYKAAATNKSPYKPTEVPTPASNNTDAPETPTDVPNNPDAVPPVTSPTDVPDDQSDVPDDPVDVPIPGTPNSGLDIVNVKYENIESKLKLIDALCETDMNESIQALKNIIGSSAWVGKYQKAFDKHLQNDTIKYVEAFVKCCKKINADIRKTMRNYQRIDSRLR